MAIVMAILTIVVLAVLLHLILYFGFKIDARQLLVAATIASLVIVFLMMALYRYYNFSPTLILLLLFLLAVISALVITFGEQYFALFPHKRVMAAKGELPAQEAEPKAETTPAETAPVEMTPEPEAGPLATVTPLAPPQPLPAEPVAAVPPLPGHLGLGGAAPVAGPTSAQASVREPEPAAPAGKDEEEIARLLDEGYDKLNKGDFRGALEAFQLAIIFVDDLDILAKLRVEMGRLWFMLEQPSMARTELQEALRIGERADNKGLVGEIRQLLDEIG